MSQKTEWVMAALQDGGMFTVATLMDATNLTEAQVIAELQALEAADLARVTRLDDRADRWRWCGEPQQKQERKPAPVAAVTTEAATAAPAAASRPLNQRILLLLETQPNINSRTVAQQLGVEIKPVRDALWLLKTKRSIKRTAEGLYALEESSAQGPKIERFRQRRRSAETREAIIQVMRDLGPAGRLDIRKRSGVSSSVIHKHLTALRAEGLLQQGEDRLYQLVDAADAQPADPEAEAQPEAKPEPAAAQAAPVEEAQGLDLAISMLDQMLFDLERLRKSVRTDRAVWALGSTVGIAASFALGWYLAGVWIAQ